MRSVPLVASRADTSTPTPIALADDFSRIDAAALQLTVSAAATDVGDTFDVYVQHSVDGGTTWDDFIHFTQVLGNGGAKKYLAFWSGRVAPETELRAPSDAALAAGVLQGPVGDKWRVKPVIVDTGTVNASFTWKLDAVLSQRV